MKRRYVMLKFLKRVGKGIERIQQRRADLWVINNLSEQQLNDIGYSRHQLRERIYGKDING
jgi:uncharacterized protein YjiS (DUF1127 family)